MDFKGGLSKYLYQVEFAYNNSYQATVGMVPHEALYGRHYRSPLTWHETNKKKVLVGPSEENSVDRGHDRGN